MSSRVRHRLHITLACFWVVPSWAAAQTARPASGEAGAAVNASPGELGASARVAPAASTTVEDATASGTTIDARDRGLALEQLSEAVTQVPGVRVRSSGGFGSFAGLSLRGAELAHTAVVLDTIPLTTADSGAFDLGLLPLSVLDRVEVYRGGAPVWLGEGAIGGVLRLVPARGSRTLLRASAGYGSYGRFQLGTTGVAASDAGAQPAVLSHASLSGAENDYPYYDDRNMRFEPDEGQTLRQQNARFTAGDGLVHAGVDALGGRMSLVALGHGRTEQVPGPLASSSSDTHRQLVRVLTALAYERERIAADGEREHRVQLLASASLQRNRLSDPFQLGMGEGTAADDLWLRGFARAGGSLRVLPWLEPTVLATFARDELRPEDPLAFSAPPRDSGRSTETIAVEPRLFGRIAGIPAELRPSLRGEWSQAEIHHVVDGTPVDERTDAFAPTFRLAVGLEPLPALSLALSLATGKRFPSLSELFGDRALIEANPTLQPERSRTVDASAVARASVGALRTSAELRGFVLWIDDMIRYERSSALTFRPENLASARVQGVEVGLNASFGRSFALVSALTALHAESQIGKALAFRPPVELLVRPELSWSPPHLDRVVLFGELQHVGFVYLDEDENGILPARTLFSLGCTLELLQRRMRLEGRVRNLFDVRASDVLSRPLPGREVLAVITVEEAGL